MFSDPRHATTLLLLTLFTALPIAAQNLRPAQEPEQAPAGAGGASGEPVSAGADPGRPSEQR